MSLAVFIIFFAIFYQYFYGFLEELEVPICSFCNIVGTWKPQQLYYICWRQLKPFSPSRPLHNKVSFPDCTPLMLSQFVHILLKEQDHRQSWVSQAWPDQEVRGHWRSTVWTAHCFPWDVRSPELFGLNHHSVGEEWTYRNQQGGGQRVRIAMRVWEGVT